MKGNKKVIDALNDVLTRELTAINQYFLHARMLENWGYKDLGDKEYHASIDEMKHADELIKRILFLDGVPSVQKLLKVNIGQNMKEIIESDLKVEEEAIPVLRKHIKLCEEVSDYVSRDLLVKILTSEEEHLDWLETQLNILKDVGSHNFHQSAT